MAHGVYMNSKDLLIEIWRSKNINPNIGGGAVRITYIPTGIKVESDKYQDVELNRKEAMKKLKAKFWEGVNDEKRSNSI